MIAAENLVPDIQIIAGTIEILHTYISDETRQTILRELLRRRELLRLLHGAGIAGSAAG